MKPASHLALALLVSGLPLCGADDGSSRIIVLSGTIAPGLPGNFTIFSSAPALNGSGLVAFRAAARSGAASESGIYLAWPTGLQTIATSGQAAPTIGGVLKNLSSPLLNESGLIAFHAENFPFSGEAIYTSTGTTLTTVAAAEQAGQSFTDFPSAPLSLSLSDTGTIGFRADRVALGTSTIIASGVYSGAGGGLTTLATTTQAAPGTGTNFTALNLPILNNVGVAALVESSSGIYTSLGSWKQTIATTSTAVPRIGGLFQSFSANLAINDSGTVAFSARNDELVTPVKRGIFSGSGGAITAIVTTVDAFPVLGGTFSGFFDPTLNNAGVVAFRGNSSTGEGIFKGSGGALQTVALSGQLRPNSSVAFSTFRNPSLNNGGTAAFLGSSVDNDGNELGSGIYLGDGQQLITVAYTGQSLAGSTIDTISFAGGADRGGAGQFNDNGQLAYNAFLANGASTIVLFTPTLHFRNATSGPWANRSNWTVSLLPASVHDVFIDPSASLTVSGPLAATTVKKLTINGIGPATATLALQSYGTITAIDGITSGAAGGLTGNGRIAGEFTNAGTIAPGLPSAAGGISITGNATLQASSRLTLDLGGLTKKTGYDFLSVSGLFTLGGSLEVSLLGGFLPQAGHSFDLFDAGSTTGAFSLLALPNLPGGLGWNTSLLATSGIVSVDLFGPVIASWGSTGGGSWATAANWTTGTVPNAAGARATFGPVPPTGGAPTVVTINGPKTVGAIVFDHAGSYQISGGAADLITLSNAPGTPSISVLAGSHTLAAPLVLAQDASASAAAGTALAISGAITGAHSLTTSGAGIVSLAGEQGYTTLIAEAGTTNVLGSFTSGTATVNARATMNFAASQTLGALNIGGAPVAPALFGRPEVVPEPGTLSLLALGALGILGRRRRRAAR